VLDDLFGEVGRKAVEAQTSRSTSSTNRRPSASRPATISAETAVTIVAVSVGTAHADVLDSPSERELDAVIGAAVWYAKYHERIITELADDRSALAVSRRDRYQQLYNGLAKLGVRLRRPEGVDPAP